MNIKGDYDDYQRFIDELSEAIEDGYTYQQDEITGYDTKRAVMNVVEMLKRWGLILFTDEN
jgi:hypothetical protein